MQFGSWYTQFATTNHHELLEDKGTGSVHEVREAVKYTITP